MTIHLGPWRSWHNRPRLAQKTVHIRSTVYFNPLNEWVDTLTGKVQWPQMTHSGWTHRPYFPFQWHATRLAVELGWTILVFVLFDDAKELFRIESIFDPTGFLVWHPNIEYQKWLAKRRFIGGARLETKITSGLSFIQQTTLSWKLPGCFGYAQILYQGFTDIKIE